MVSTLVYVSSNWSEKPTTSKSRSGRALSSERSATPCSRSFASMSVQGAYARSASSFGCPFKIP